LKGIDTILFMVISDDQSGYRMGGSRIVSASEFKAKCLDILDRVGRRELERVVITKRGVAVAEAAEVERLHGFCADRSSSRRNRLDGAGRRRRLCRGRG
jgi:antitoxin (DNA-binding transcriptional repressor) of toxin-antitoxin stability system